MHYHIKKAITQMIFNFVHQRHLLENGCRMMIGAYDWFR